ncbi:MAG: hypothetical protein V3W34_17020 [Phycisphaerae bacterium]
MTTRASTKRGARSRNNSVTPGAQEGRQGHKSSGEPPDPMERRAMIDFRDRMRHIGGLVRESFGPRRGSDYASVTRDACRVVVSLIIETLSEATERISTAELAAVCKMLAEQRKLDIAQMEIERKYPKKPSGGNRSPASRRGPLPERFGQIVEEIYGTNISDTTSQPETDKP